MRLRNICGSRYEGRLRMPREFFRENQERYAGRKMVFRATGDRDVWTPLQLVHAQIALIPHLEFEREN